MIDSNLSHSILFFLAQPATDAVIAPILAGLSFALLVALTIMMNVEANRVKRNRQ